MATKLSDLMLDMETGDACLEDAYIAEAKGKINVSHAIFEAAYKNYELPDDGQFVCYVESDQEGIPTKSEKAAGLSCAAVGQELGAFLDATIEVARKVKASSEKDLKTLIAAGKKVGVNMSENFEGGFAAPLGKAIVVNGRLSLNNSKFIKSRNACKIAKAYTKGMINICAAFGVNISGDINALIKNFTGAGDVKGTIDSLKALESKLNDGGKALSIGDAAEGTVDSIKAGDVTDLAMSIYCVANVADVVIKNCSGTKKDTVAMINKFCGEDCKDGKVSRTCEAINGDIQRYMGNLESIGKAIASGFTDSVYALMETISK